MRNGEKRAGRMRRVIQIRPKRPAVRRRRLWPVPPKPEERSSHRIETGLVPDWWTAKSVFIRGRPWFNSRREIDFLERQRPARRAEEKFSRLSRQRNSPTCCVCRKPNAARTTWSSSGRLATPRSGTARKRRGIPARPFSPRTRPLQVEPHIDIAEHDQEGRVLAAEFDGFLSGKRLCAQLQARPLPIDLPPTLGRRFSCVI